MSIHNGLSSRSSWRRTLTSSIQYHMIIAIPSFARGSNSGVQNCEVEISPLLLCVSHFSWSPNLSFRQAALRLHSRVHFKNPLLTWFFSSRITVKDQNEQNTSKRRRVILMGKKIKWLSWWFRGSVTRYIAVGSSTFLFDLKECFLSGAAWIWARVIYYASTVRHI